MSNTDPSEGLKQFSAEWESAWQAVTAASAARDVGGLAIALARIKELVRLDRQLSASLENVRRLGTTAPLETAEVAGRKRRYVTLVSIAMVEQGFLLFKKRGSRRSRIRDGEITVETIPGGDRFEVEVFGDRLSTCPGLRKFYQEAGVESGDTVSLEERDGGTWLLAKCDPTEEPSVAVAGLI